jgi:hypothetical protein
MVSNPYIERSEVLHVEFVPPSRPNPRHIEELNARGMIGAAGPA